MLKIFPKPKNIQLSAGRLPLSSQVELRVDSQIETILEVAGFNYADSINSIFSKHMHEEPIAFNGVCLAAVPDQGYILTISANGIRIACSSAVGFYYGVLTLGQIVNQCKESLPFLCIQDAPVIALRGIILDIGRNKIPTMKTLFEMIDMLSEMRINHLQLYMEGFCFDYKKYRYLFSDETPITAEEFQKLSQYARSRFIDLVPNQNCSGHMDQWLSRPQMRDLAECPSGFLHDNLYMRPPMTLDVSDEKAFALIAYFFEQLLPNFDSNFVNVNLDEPFELGMGKNKEKAEKYGRGKLYLDYVNKIHALCNRYDKKMLMWGDVMFTHPDLIDELPKDIMVLDWIYEGDSTFESHCRIMAQKGIEFCLCPGTASWCSFTGRTDNMIKNIADAVNCAVKFGAKGVITTDWGDLGHWQYLPVSYLGFAHTAADAWSGEQVSTEAVEDYCNQYVFMDTENKAYRVLYDLGNYYHKEYASLYNTTLAFAVMSSKYSFSTAEEFSDRMQRLLKISENIAKGNGIPFDKPYIDINYTEMKSYLKDVEKRLEDLKLGCADGALIKDELQNALRMIRHGTKLYRVMTQPSSDREVYIGEMSKLFIDLCGIIEKHYDLWVKRNRNGGFTRSIEPMQHLLEFYTKEKRVE